MTQWITDQHGRNWRSTGRHAWRVGAATHTTPLLPGRKRHHHDRLHLGIVIGALVVLAAWGVSELLR